MGRSCSSRISFSKCDRNVAFRRVDTGSDHLSLLPVDLPGPQVPHFAGAEPADAGVADPHPATERQLGARLLTGDEDRRAAVTGGFDRARGEADRSSLARHGAAADHRLEALHLQQLRVPLLAPVLDEVVEHLAWAG